MDSWKSLGYQKAQQTSQDQPGETSPNDASFDPLSGEDAVAEEVLDSPMCPSVSKAPTAVASRDLPSGETSPKEESLDLRSGEGGDYRLRRVTLILGSVRDDACGTWRKISCTPPWHYSACCL